MAMIKLTRDFKEFLSLLNSEKIEYLLIGGYAVGYYGYIRPTKDMDVWIAVDPANLERLVGVLAKFGFAPGSIRADDFLRTETVFRMGMPPNRIEVITRISGVEFSECYARRVMVAMDDVQVPIISYEDLKRNKNSTGRLRDRGDIEQLDKARTRLGQ